MSSENTLPIHFLPDSGFSLNEITVNETIQYCKNNHIRVVIFDSLVRIHNENENDATAMAGVAKMLREIAKNSITVIFTHHNRKNKTFNPTQDMRGSSDILASVGCQLAIERKARVITVMQAKLRQKEELEPFNVEIATDEVSYLQMTYNGKVDKKQKKEDELKMIIFSVLQQQSGLNKTEIFNRAKVAGLKHNKATLNKIIEKLINNGEIFTKRGNRTELICSLEPFGNE